MTFDDRMENLMNEPGRGNTGNEPRFTDAERSALEWALDRASETANDEHADVIQAMLKS